MSGASSAPLTVHLLAVNSLQNWIPPTLLLCDDALLCSSSSFGLGTKSRKSYDHWFVCMISFRSNSCKNMENLQQKNVAFTVLFRLLLCYIQIKSVLNFNGVFLFHLSSPLFTCTVVQPHALLWAVKHPHCTSCWAVNEEKEVYLRHFLLYSGLKPRGWTAYVTVPYSAPFDIPLMLLKEPDSLNHRRNFTVFPSYKVASDCGSDPLSVDSREDCYWSVASFKMSPLLSITLWISLSVVGILSKVFWTQTRICFSKISSASCTTGASCAHHWQFLTVL